MVATACAAAATATGFLAVTLAMLPPDDETLLLALGVAAGVLGGLAASLRYRRYGAADPIFLFAVGFVAYNSLVPIQVALRDRSQALILANVSTGFGRELYGQAAFLALLGALALFGVTLLTTRRSPPAMRARPSDLAPAAAMRLAGAAVYTAGLGMMVGNFLRLGDLSQVLSLERGARYTLDSAARGSLPYVPFALAGIALLWAAYVATRSREDHLRALGAAILWILLNLFLGDRRWSLYVFIVVLAIEEGERLWRFRLRGKTIMAILALYIGAATFAQARYLVAPVLGDKLSIGEAVDTVREKASEEWLLPTNNEFAAPYFTLLYTLDQDKPHRYGATYLRSIPDVLPRSLYPGEKPPSLGSEYAQRIHDRYRPMQREVSGFGLSPLAEGYLNFGVIGAVFEILVAALIAAWLSRHRWRTPTGAFAFALLLPQALVFHRAGSSLLEAFWFGVAIATSVVAVRLCERRSARGPVRQVATFKSGKASSAKSHYLN
jgi:hypothetical protein